VSGGPGGGFIRAVGLRRDEIPSFAEYPFSIPAIATLDVLPLHPAVTYLVGENGTGKSTLLEAMAIAAGLNPEGGGRNFAFSTQRSESELAHYLTLVRGAARPATDFFLRAESLFNVASEVDRLEDETRGLLDSYGGKSLHDQSHGESFLALTLNRFGADGLYFLDEPEAALSLHSSLAMLRRIHDLVRAGSQFVVATHSPIVMAYPDAVVYRFSDTGIEEVAYESSDQVVLMRDFMADPARFVHYLLMEED
jgi:predicted ATPase